MMQTHRCPVSCSFVSYADPVLAMDGHAYERAAIKEWLARNNTSPTTGAQLPSLVLVENHTLRSLIQDWLVA